MPYRWDLSHIPPYIDPQVVRQVGRYAAKILALRGIHTPQAVAAFVNPDVYLPTPPTELPDMERAVARLLQARTRGEKVMIWGDFDCDGVTSTALLLSALRPLGLSLDFTIPLRAAEGHGLHPERLAEVAQQGSQLILTVDCGVGNRAEIEQAQQMGIDVIVTDHHLLPDPLPPALAVVNPLRLPADHPLRLLPGVGVAYKLAEAVYQALAQPGVEQFLDLVVVGIVADVAVLQRECRYLVQKGLPILAQTQRLGLQLLMANLPEKAKTGIPTAQDIGFRMAPKLNAIGRLDDARLAVELLTTSDAERAKALMDLFLATNETRKALTQVVIAQASQQIELQALDQQKAIVLASPDWNQGVVGIAAAKLVETYGCPTVLIACHPQRQEGYGSGRSIPSVNLVEALNAVGSLLSGYGGHPMAAGLRVSLAHLPALQAALTQQLASLVKGDIQQRDLPIELFVDAQQVADVSAVLTDMFEQLTLLEPFGQGNPRPLLAVLNLESSHLRPQTSRNGQHLSFSLGSHKLWFWGEGSQLTTWQKPGRLDIAFVLEDSTWQGQGGWQGNVKALRWATADPLPTWASVELQVEDYRQTQPPMATATLYAGQIPVGTSSDLCLREWPFWAEELATLLQTVRPKRLQLAGHAYDFQGIPRWIAQLVRDWQAGIRDPHQLAQGGIPLPILTKWLNEPSVLEAEVGDPAIERLLHLLREAQSFHYWLDRASSHEILKLCKRLLSDDSWGSPA
ncbi:MAG: single-stranded-DNA-specific exonuclease RecJ [Cyanobacteriota bacterium]|nr:single-stranded-DNA-specific exonuclease RecJ [Cyanobacteriota bacterium]